MRQRIKTVHRFAMQLQKSVKNYLQAPHRKTEIEQHELHMKAGGLAL
jgi:hypothetical protein